LQRRFARQTGDAAASCAVRGGRQGFEQAHRSTTHLYTGVIVHHDEAMDRPHAPARTRLPALVGPLAVLLALLAGCHAAQRAGERLHVVLVGDSTMAHVTGYGDALCARFDAGTRCVNLARGGRSSKSYRAEGLWDGALGSLRERGYRSVVLIQFGHNDQPGKPGRSTTLDEYEANLHRYVDEARAAGADPVLVTPLTRRTFRDGRLLDDLQPWAEATARVARSTGVPLLDLHADSRRAVETLGAVAALSLAELPPPGQAVAAARTGTTSPAIKPPPAAVAGTHVPVFDYTHLGAQGAALFSGIVAQEIATSIPGLSAHLR
jgi:lysophospholipase L1-like esterase